MRLYFPVDLTGNLIMIEKLVLGEIWTGDLPIFNPDALTLRHHASCKLIVESNSPLTIFPATVESRYIKVQEN